MARRERLIRWRPIDIMAVALDDAKAAMAIIQGVDSTGCEAETTGGSIWNDNIAYAAGNPCNEAVTVAR